MVVLLKLIVLLKLLQDKITDTVTNVKDEMKQLRKAMVNPLNN
jgi:hypothetical protein